MTQISILTINFAEILLNFIRILLAAPLTVTTMTEGMLGYLV